MTLRPAAVATPIRAAAPFAGPILLVAGATAATSSVVRFDLRIVGTYTALALLLLLALIGAGRRSDAPSGTGTPRGPALARLGRYPAAVALVLTGLSTLQVHAFTYLQPGDAATVRRILAAAAFGAAALLVALPRRGADAALGLALLAYTVTGALLIRLNPVPRIDVWYTLQGAADAIAGGHDIYTEVWTAPTGIMEAFTYLPWTAVLLAPGRWLFGDVRWALMAITVVGALALRGYVPRHRAAGPAQGNAAAAALLLLLPGTATMVEQAWTEPVLLAGIAAASLAWRARRPALAALLLATALASKQHLALLVPLLLVWPRFGARRTAVVGATAGLLVLPWFLADPAAMWHDTVTYLVNFPPLQFSDTLFIAAQRELSWTPPFWLTGAVVLSVVGAAARAVHRRDPGPGELLRWAALVLLVANLVNKQAFYNQFWLVGALVLASWANPEEEAADGRGPGDAPGLPAAEPREVTPPVDRPASAAI